MPRGRQSACPADVLLRGEPLRVEGVGKSFGGQRVLDDVGIAVPAGGILALLGPSGCGKTTLLRCIAGLEQPDAGRIRVGDRLLHGPGVHVPAERRRVAMVFQQPALFPHMSVAANVGYGLPRRERRGDRVAWALDLVGLGGMGDRMPQTLSGGQQQRVALARALAPQPTAILFDEPFSSLDAPLRAQLRLEIRDVLATLSTTAVFVTHDQEEAFLVGDEVAVMLDGRVAQCGTPADLYAAPASRDVATFIGDANLVPARGEGDRALTPIGAVPLTCPARGDVEVVIRPESIRAVPGGDAVVEHVEFYGHDAVYLVRTCDGCPLRARCLGVPCFRPGDRVALDYVGSPSVAFGMEGPRAPRVPVPAGL